MSDEPSTTPFMIGRWTNVSVAADKKSAQIVAGEAGRSFSVTTEGVLWRKGSGRRSSICLTDAGNGMDVAISGVTAAS